MPSFPNLQHTLRRSLSFTRTDTSRTETTDNDLSNDTPAEASISHRHSFPNLASFFGRPSRSSSNSSSSKESSHSRQPTLTSIEETKMSPPRRTFEPPCRHTKKDFINAEREIYKFPPSVWELKPPYPHPLQGIYVKFGIHDPASQKKLKTKLDSYITKRQGVFETQLSRSIEKTAVAPHPLPSRKQQK